MIANSKRREAYLLKDELQEWNDGRMGRPVFKKDKRVDFKGCEVVNHTRWGQSFKSSAELSASSEYCEKQEDAESFNGNVAIVALATNVENRNEG